MQRIEEKKEKCFCLTYLYNNVKDVSFIVWRDFAALIFIPLFFYCIFKFYSIFLWNWYRPLAVLAGPFIGLHFSIKGYVFTCQVNDILLAKNNTYHDCNLLLSYQNQFMQFIFIYDYVTLHRCSIIIALSFRSTPGNIGINCRKKVFFMV